jgi:hypothetical protein
LNIALSNVSNHASKSGIPTLLLGKAGVVGQLDEAANAIVRNGGQPSGITGVKIEYRFANRDDGVRQVIGTTELRQATVK